MTTERWERNQVNKSQLLSVNKGCGGKKVLFVCFSSSWPLFLENHASARKERSPEVKAGKSTENLFDLC